MAKNPFAKWINDPNEEEQDKYQRPDPNSWEYYRWAGGNEYFARSIGARQAPVYVTEDEWQKLARIGEGVPSTPYTPKSPSQDAILNQLDAEDAAKKTGRTLSPGEKLALTLGGAMQRGGESGVLGLNAFTGLSKLADYVMPAKTDQGAFSDVRRFTSDFLRGAGTGIPQTIADVAGSIADVVTGNTGKGQNYTIAQNRPQLYADPGGAGQVVGSFAPDIAAAVATYGASAGSLGRLAARAPGLQRLAGREGASLATKAAANIGGWTAAGSTPTALKLGGRFISPAATRAERIAASLAAGVPAAMNVAPEVASGRMNALEGALNVAVNTAAGPLSAGQWGGKFLTNLAGDVAVNVGAQAVSEAIPAIVPGGAEFNAADVWKNLSYGAAMGTLFGVMNARPMQGAGERAVLGAKAPEQAAPTQSRGLGVGGGIKPAVVDLAQKTEQALFGQATIPDDASPQVATARLAEIRSIAAEELPSLAPDEFGNVSSIADQYRAEAPSDIGLMNAVDTERKVYARTLAARYADNPENLVTLLDLEVKPGEITPENAVDVLAAKIENEWLIQPAEGKGIAGVEKRLGLLQRLNGPTAEGQAESLSGAPGSDVVARTGPEVSPTDVAPLPESIAMRTSQANAAPVQMAESVAMRTAMAQPDAIRTNVVGQNALSPQVEESVRIRSSAFDIVRQADENLNVYKEAAAETGFPVEQMVPENSIESKLLEAENAGVPKEDAQATIANDLVSQPESFDLTPAEESALAGQQPVGGQGATEAAAETGREFEQPGVGSPVSQSSLVVDAGSATAGSYERTSVSRPAVIGGDDVTVTSEYRPTQSTVDAIRKEFPDATVDEPILEITGSPATYHRLISEAKNENKFGASVYVYPVEEYASMRLFVTEDGKSGLALKEDGDLVSGFSKPDPNKKNRLMNLLVLGIKEGATKADCFDTVLPDYYANVGFRAVARVPFDPTQAPTAYVDEYGFQHKGWDEETFKSFSDGKPDVVMLVYDGGPRSTIEQRIGTFPSYKQNVRDQLPPSTYDEALQSVSDALIPTPESAMAETARPKRARMPRKINVSEPVISQSKSALLEVLEGPDGQYESDVQYKGSTSAPRTELSADFTNRLAKTMVGLMDQLSSLKSDTDVGELSRQNARTIRSYSKQMYDIMHGEGSTVKIKKPSTGGTPSDLATKIAEMEGIPYAALQVAVHGGRTKFWEGALDITPGDGPNDFIVKMNIDATERGRIGEVIEVYDKTGRLPDVVSKAEVLTKAERIAKMESAYQDLYDDYNLVTSEAEMLRSQGRDVPDDVSIATRSEAMEIAEEDGGLASAGYEDINKSIDKQKSDWRYKYQDKLEKAVSYVQKYMEKKVPLNQYLMPGTTLSPVDIKYYIASKLGPGKFRELGEQYVENTMPWDVRSVLDENFDRLYDARGVETNPLFAYVRHNSKIDEAWFDEMYDSYVPKFANAMEAASDLAQKAGIESPNDIIRMLQWDRSGGDKFAQKNLLETVSSLSREPVQFDQAKADDVRAKINSAIDSDPNAMKQFDSVVHWIDKNRGSEAFRYILNENLMGNSGAYKINLRNMLTLRNASIATSMFLLDEGVDNIEENETYFGIPGSTLKKLLGNGDAGVYALAYGGFISGLPVSQKPGAKQGMRARAGNFLRKSVNKGAMFGSSPNVSTASMTPDQKVREAEMFVARNFKKLEPGSPEFEQMKANKLAAEDYAKLSGSRVAEIADKWRKDKSAGTVGLMAEWLSDIKLMGARSKFVQDMIVAPYTKMQGNTRRILKSVEEPINVIAGGLLNKYQKDANFFDAIWAADYNFSQLEISDGTVSPDVQAAMREKVMDDVRKAFFEDANGNVNTEAWTDFNNLQEAIGPLRREHLRALVAKSLGINSWDIESHYAELLTNQSRLNESIGAAEESITNLNEQINLLQEYAKNTPAMEWAAGAGDTPLEISPGIASKISELKRARIEQKDNLRKFIYEKQRVESRLGTINSLDDMIAKSMSNMYMFRLRDNTAPLVVRVQFDPKSGVPSVRREYDSLAEAKMGEIDILRGAAEKIQAKDYAKFKERKEKITTRLEELDALDEMTPEMELEYTSLNKELDSMRGVKPVSEMSDAEVFRFASTYDQLGAEATIRDMRNSRKRTVSSTAAKKLLDLVMSTSDPIEAQLLTRSIDGGALTDPVTNQVNLVPNKGNASLMDRGSSSQVVVRQGEDVPSLEDLVNEIDDLIDEPIDRTQLRELLEQYTYRDTAINPKGKQIQTVWVDMAAMRRLIQAYTDPYVPNLVKRHNWTGYYDPDGSWTVKQRADYTVKSIEGMLSQIQNYNSQVALRNSVQAANDWLDKWDIRNGLKEYIAGLQMYNDKYMRDGLWDRLHEYELSIRRGVSFATLAVNLGSAIGNRFQGASIAVAHGLQNASTKYGVYQINPDGSKGPVKWMSSELAARAELYSKQEKGELNWNVAQGFNFRGQFNAKAFGLGIAAIASPKRALEYLARKDGYGTLPESAQGQWAMIYRLANASNLEQGGVIGSYTVRQGIETQTKREKILRGIGWLTDKVETTNNYSSLLMSGLDIQNRFGLTDTDWNSLGLNQKKDAVNQILIPHVKRLDASSRARQVMESEILKIQEEIDALGDSAAQRQRKMALEKKLVSKKERASRLDTESSVLLDTMNEYLVFNRGFEQGDWDKATKSKVEKAIESLPGGTLAMTMTAPILRSYNSWMAMMRTANATEGGKLDKIGRASGPILGAAILTSLFGGQANPLSMFGIYLSDISAIAEMLYAYMNEEDGERLDKVSGQQVWEDIAGNLAEKYNMDPEDAKRYVRAAWPLGQSEGFFRSVMNANVNAGAGLWDITGGGMPAGVILQTGKNIGSVWSSILKKADGEGTTYDFAYGLSNAMPTSIKRLTQTSLQALMPAHVGGFGLVKVDKFGQPVYDKNFDLQRLSAVDVARNTFLGKPWSDTRSRLIKYEGGTPLYTEEDRIAWANTLLATPYLKFGETSKSSLRGRGVAETSQAARFEVDAPKLQRSITNEYQEMRPYIDEAKNRINQMYVDNEMIDIGGGKQMPLRKILSIVAASGTKSDVEIKGSAPDEVRKSMLALAEDWGRSTAVANAVQKYYGNSIEVSASEDLQSTSSPDEFAIMKLGQRFSRSYLDWLKRQEGRSMFNP